MWRGRPWSESLQKALLQGDGKKLRALAEKLIQVGLGGDVSAIREIGDRIQGKPQQDVQITGSPISINILSREAHLLAITRATDDSAAIDGESERLDR
jgi:hypothetical protein